MKELVEVVAKALVDNPDEVVVTEKKEGKQKVLCGMTQNRNIKYRLYKKAGALQ